MPAKITPKGKRMTPEQFKAALLDLDIPHGKLGEVWGVSRELVCRWSNGKVPIPGWVRYALAGVPVIRAQTKPIAEPAKPVEAPKPVAAPTAPNRVGKPVRGAVDCSPAPVPGKWRFGIFYPD